MIITDFDFTGEQSRINSDGGGVLAFPAATIQGHFTVSASNIVFRGLGIDATILQPEDGYAGLMIRGVPASPQSRITFEDMTTSGPVAFYGAQLQRLAFRNVRFTSTFSLYGCSGAQFDCCQFDAPGTADHIGINLGMGCQHIAFDRCEFSYLKSGISVDNGNPPYSESASDISITNCRFIFDWWTIKAIASGVAEYTATTLTDSAAEFSFPALEARHVRVMPVKATGTMAWTAGMLLSDANAQFIVAGVKPGDIVRTDTAHTIVLAVESETLLRVDEWKSLDTYQPVPIAANTSYTVYGVLAAKITSYTPTTITVDSWRDLYGQIGLPANGTRYEVVVDHAYYPIATEYTTSRLTVRDCYVRGAWGDSIAIRGPESLIAGNTILFGRDMGMSICGDNSIIRDNRVENSGANNILSQGANTVIEANCLINSRCRNIANLYGLANIHVDGNHTRILANNCLDNNHGMFGVVIDSAQNVVLRDNVVTGHSDASLKLANGATAQYQDNYFDNDVMVE